MRPFIFAANWKMYKTPEESKKFFEEFSPLIPKDKQAQCIFYAPAINLTTISQTLKGSPIRWGAQNCYFETKGAFTGENSPQVIAHIGAQSCLVGHSERRTIFGEKDELLSKKVKILQEFNLLPMLCVGETLQEREAGKTNEVIIRQLKEGLKLFTDLKPIAVAYEPVWAIGTGKVATTGQAEEAHAVLRKALKEIKPGLEAQTPILYGGSVKPDNAQELSEQPNVDGFLVGGASLEPKSFAAIVNIKLNKTGK